MFGLLVLFLSERRVNDCRARAPVGSGAGPVQNRDGGEPQATVRRIGGQA